MRVRFTPQAKRDLDQIHAHISQDSPTIASRFVARIFERAQTLADFPYEGMKTDEPDTRVILAPRLYFLQDCVRRNTHYPYPPHVATTPQRVGQIKVASTSAVYPAPINGTASSRSYK
ncbi:MAG: type II toxin-antitoxin system RelE/ParE family toxin [Bradyrhizobium icense]|nr:MAG: type II toxin-antitoxin system RelE/ParE family toxin [Bradyrhizobium icense]